MFLPAEALSARCVVALSFFFCGCTHSKRLAAPITVAVVDVPEESQEPQQLIAGLEMGADRQDSKPVAPLVAWKAILVTVFTAAVLEGIWLSSRLDYHTALFTAIQGTGISVRVVPTLLLYVILFAAMYITVLKPSRSLRDAAVRGAGLGFLLYSFYDLTNYATFTAWSLEMTLIDTLWGTFMCCLSSTAGAFAGGRRK